MDTVSEQEKGCSRELPVPGRLSSKATGASYPYVKVS